MAPYIRIYGCKYVCLEDGGAKATASIDGRKP